MQADLRFVMSSVLCFSVSGLFAAMSGGEHDLTFEDRLDAQRAIERVKYAHQIGAKKTFDEAVSRQALELKVRDYLARSAALEYFWRTPITEAALREEWARIAEQSGSPDRLREIYAALNHDSRLIAECLLTAI